MGLPVLAGDRGSSEVAAGLVMETGCVRDGEAVVEKVVSNGESVDPLGNLHFMGTTT